MPAPHLQLRHESSQAVIGRLCGEIDRSVRPLVPGTGRLALLDFPDYSNVGDSAIWLGEVNYLRHRQGIRPAYVCHLEKYHAQALRQALPEGPIFLSGGGNFGDIWPGFQEFREQVLEDFPDRQVVQLPQSIHFQSQRRLDSMALAIHRHGNFVLMVRDEVSLEIAEQNFDCQSLLVPDMAFALGPQAWPARPEQPRIGLLRTDRERRSDWHAEFRDLPRFDWIEGDVCGTTVGRQAKLRMLPELGLKIRNPLARREHLYRHLAAARVARGLKQLTRAQTVVSDRLHGHILCTLLGQPHTMLDNSYGKVGRFIDCWTRNLDILKVLAPMPASEPLAIPA